MYFPHFIMLVGFTVRVCWAMCAMMEGRSGPWEIHMRKSNYGDDPYDGSDKDSSVPVTAVTDGENPHTYSS